MAATAENLAAIQTAISNGSLRVKYKDREVEYRSMADLIKAYNFTYAQLNAGNSNVKRQVRLHFRSGL